MIAARQSLGLHIGRDDYGRGVQAADTRPPQSQKELVIFSTRKIGRKEAEAIEQVVAKRRVGGGQAKGIVRVYVKRLVPVIQERERPPVIPGEPRGRRGAPMRQDLAAQKIDLRVEVEFPFDVEDPIFRHPHVVVGEGDDRRARGGEPRVARVRHSLPRLEHVPEIRVAPPNVALDYAPGRVGRVVVNDYHLVADLTALLREHTFDRRRQHLPPVVRADYYGYFMLLGHTTYVLYKNSFTPPQPELEKSPLPTLSRHYSRKEFGTRAAARAIFPVALLATPRG